MLESINHAFKFLSQLHVEGGVGFSLFTETFHGSRSWFQGSFVLVHSPAFKEYPRSIYWVMNLRCDELDNLLGFGPMQWYFVDDLNVYRSGI